MTLAQLRQDWGCSSSGELSNGQHPRYLFRGTSRDHGNLQSTFARLSSDRAAYESHMLYKQAQKVAGAMEGYRVQKLDALAVLQHYGWPSPLLDWTSSLEIAVWFALFHAKPMYDCLVYRIDLSKVPRDLLVFQNRDDEILASWQIPDAEDKGLLLDHFFLTHPLDSGGLKHRWLRQEGFAITPAQFDLRERVASFDLLKHPVAEAIEARTFRHSRNDCSIETPDLLSLDNDPIPRRLQEIIPLVVQPWLQGPLCGDLQSILENMDVPAVSTRVDT